MKLAILSSTRARSVRPLINEIKQGTFPGVTIELVLSNKADAECLSWADQNGLKTYFVDSRGWSRAEYDSKLSSILSHHQVDLVLLVGYMRLLSEEFVAQWSGQLVNIHPSLLPAFPGLTDLNVHKAVLDRGCKVTGATLMFVDANADTGPIIDQEVIRVAPEDTPETLKEKVQTIEAQLLIQGIQQIKNLKNNYK
jgi:phosphoribosylglycinamide formyltransferase 1